MLDGYDGALHLSLGRVIEVSVAAIAARALRHDGAASEPQGRAVAHRRRAALPVRPHGQEHQGREAAASRPAPIMKRMYTDTVSPHSAGMKFAIDYYGIDHVMYGTDYPCWDPATCLRLHRRDRTVAGRPAEALLRQRPAHPRLARPGAAAEPDVRTRTRSCLSGLTFLRQSNPGASCRQGPAPGQRATAAGEA